MKRRRPKRRKQVKQPKKQTATNSSSSCYTGGVSFGAIFGAWAVAPQVLDPIGTREGPLALREAICSSTQSFQHPVLRTVEGPAAAI